jgi:hypothetical protein
MQISMRQKMLIDELIKEMLDPKTCKKATVGKPRFDGTDYVDVNRPLQQKNSKHDLYVCDSDYWSKFELFPLRCVDSILGHTSCFSCCFSMRSHTLGLLASRNSHNRISRIF